MHILGIDFGTKKIGLAWCDDALDIVLPYGVIAHRVWQSELVQLIKSERIELVVVGMPYGDDGQENDNTRRVRAFVEELRVLVAVRVEIEDERYSTHEAVAMEGDASLDEKSAMIVLDAYLSDKRKH